MSINKLENLPRTDKQTDTQTDRQRIQLQRPLLSPVDRRGERANKWQGPALVACSRTFENYKILGEQRENREQTENSITEATFIPCGSSGGAGQYIITSGLVKDCI